MRKEEKIVRLSYIVYYFVLLGVSFYCYSMKTPNLSMALVASFSCFLVPIFLKLIHIQSSVAIYIVNILFVFVANVLGSMLNFYAFEYFDKILHFTSGFLICQLSYMIYLCLNENRNHITCILFLNSLNMLVAVLWEFFEYACLIFLKNDAIHHYSSGVHDCIQDMMIAFVGGLFVTFFVLRYFKTNRMNMLIQYAHSFEKYQKNFT